MLCCGYSHFNLSWDGKKRRQERNWQSMKIVGIFRASLHHGPWSRTRKMAFFHGPTWWSNFHNPIFFLKKKPQFTKPLVPSLGANGMWTKRNDRAPKNECDDNNISLPWTPAFSHQNTSFASPTHRKTRWTMPLDNAGLEPCLLKTCRTPWSLRHIFLSVNGNDRGTSPPANHKVHMALRQLHGPWCKHPFLGLDVSSYAD